MCYGPDVATERERELERENMDQFHTIIQLEVHIKQLQEALKQQTETVTSLMNELDRLRRK